MQIDGQTKINRFEYKDVEVQILFYMVQMT